MNMSRLCLELMVFTERRFPPKEAVMRRLFCILVLFAFAACQTVQSPTPTAPQLKQAKVNGVKLTYVEQGKGIPVVFVHGALSDYRVWEPQREAIAQHYRFVSYTQRYFGTDAWPDDGKNFSAVTHAADLAEFVRVLNAGPVHLVSWSYGGLVATLMALEHPELVRSQVLFEPTIRSLITDLPEGKAAAAQVANVYTPAIAAAKSGDTAQATKLFMEAVFRLPPGGFDTESQVWRKIWLDSARSVPPQVAAPPPPAITCDRLKATKSPMLVMRGANTYAMWSLISEHMVRCAPGSRLMTIPNINHDGPMRDPVAFNVALLDFLKKN
jgi:pimeloyl-ACP methyl ester carboxylesterase